MNSIKCFQCGKTCSTIVPDDFVLRGTVTCPECEQTISDDKYYDGIDDPRLVILENEVKKTGGRATSRRWRRNEIA